MANYCGDISQVLHVLVIIIVIHNILLLKAPQSSICCPGTTYPCTAPFYYFRYNWLPTQRLLELSIPKLAAEGALVAVWVTNKRKLAIFIRQILFPKWNVHHMAEWHWLKVCISLFDLCMMCN